MSEIELKACPFCGGTPKHTLWGDDEFHRIECDICDVGMDYFDSAEYVAESWNTRAPQWQPIEIAPKDGTFILALVRGFTPAVAKWTTSWRPDGSFEYLGPDMFAEEEHWLAFVDSTDAWQPTHWMPLPSLPEETK